MHILFLYADSDSEWNCSEWRCHIPSNAINAENEAGRTKHTAQLIHLPSALNFNHPKVQQILGRADVISFQRNAITSDVWEAMSYWRAIGKTVTIDLDDDYPGLPPSNPAHAYWILNKAGLPYNPVDGLAEGIKRADALTAPSKVLLADWEHIAPGFWIPNWPRRAWYEKCVPRPLGDKDVVFHYRVNPENANETLFEGVFREGSEGWIILGWGGSISHMDSWIYSGAIEALDRIFEKYPQARLKFCGYEQRLDHLFERWGDRVIRQAGVRPEHWPFVVSTFDIGLAPLDMRPIPSNTGKEGEEKWEGGKYSYDERRSWLKGVEYMAAGVPWLGTRSATYEGLARFGKMVENSMEDHAKRVENWFTALDAMMESLPTRRAQAVELKKWTMKKYTMEANVQGMMDTYERIGNLKRGQRGGLPNVHWHRVAA